MRRAIRRIGWVETVVLGFTMVAAMVGGALLALLASSALGWPFRRLWIGCSVVLFAVPAFIHTARESRADRTRGRNPETTSGS